MEVSSLPPAAVHNARLPVFATHLRFSSDEQLVERFRNGHDEAFRVIHDRYRARLHAYVRQMLSGRSAEDVEDLLQDVFERAARTLRSGPAPVGLRAWLYSVARNRCIDELRRRPPASPDVLAASRLPTGDTSSVAERRADVERLFNDLRALPELQRSALLMRELQGLSHTELAEVLGATVPAVKSLLVRARVGLVDAEQARGVPCATIRDDLAAAYDRRVKTSAQASRHLRECSACSTYRAELRLTSRRIAALIPGPALLPLGLLGRLFGRSGVDLKGSAAASSVAGAGGPVVAGVGKVAAILSVATVATAGVAIERSGGIGSMMPWSSSPPKTLSAVRLADTVKAVPVVKVGTGSPRTRLSLNATATVGAPTAPTSATGTGPPSASAPLQSSVTLVPGATTAYGSPAATGGSTGSSTAAPPEPTVAVGGAQQPDPFARVRAPAAPAVVDKALTKLEPTASRVISSSAAAALGRVSAHAPGAASLILPTISDALGTLSTAPTSAGAGLTATVSSGTPALAKAILPASGSLVTVPVLANAAPGARSAVSATTTAAGNAVSEATGVATSESDKETAESRPDVPRSKLDVVPRPAWKLVGALRR